MRRIEPTCRVVALGLLGLSLAATGGAQDSWSATSTVGAPRGRNNETSVWTGSRMIVWGGFSDSGTDLNTGDRYDPAANSWADTSLVGVPSPRYLHAAVWTGTRMIVWGGSYTPDSGGRYDPATNSWASMSRVGAPSMSVPTAVWTGTRMIVWGGSSALPTPGGLYDPATDSWAAMSMVGAPTRPFGHSAVWTGSKMIVWGGHSVGNSPTLEGGAYDPVTNTWTSTSTVGAPTARSYHTVVWTGSRMIVWGGTSDTAGTSLLNTGGIYDPAADTWAPMSLAGAPTGRWGHSAVWTGLKMIAWGGYGGTPAGYLNTGGLYDPVANAWAPTGTVGVPNARSGHAAAWTGTRMIVWGGSASGGTLTTGGVYDPGSPSLLSISDAGASEGAEAQFTVTLAPASAQTVTVELATANGTATAPADYLAVASTLTFAPGETTKQVSVTVNADALDEPEETFFVNLTNPTNAVLGDGQGLGTINRAVRFFSSSPCRILDTRDPDGPLGGPVLSPGQQRTFTVTGGACVVPTTAKALSVNLTVVGPTAAGFVTVFPGDGSLPPTSSINFSAGQIRANNGVFRLAGDGSGRLNVVNGSSGSTHVILDVNGYFE